MAPSPAENDPASSQDNLPQPYRMIWKIIDEYILDPAWLDITRLHPELLQDDKGEAFATPHNQALANICTPSMVVEQAHGNTSIIESQGLLFMATDHDAFVVVEANDGKIVQSIVLEEPPPVKTAEELAAEAEAAAAAADPKNKKKAAAAADTDAPPPKPAKVSSMWIASVSEPITADRVLVFSVCSIVENEEEAPPDPNADPKAKKKGGGETEMVKVPKCRVIIVHATLGVTEGFKSSLIKLAIVGEAYITMASHDVGDIGKVDVSLDGKFLCVSTSLGISMFTLPNVVQSSRTAIGKVENVEEEVLAEDPEEDADKPEENEDTLILEPLLNLTSDQFFEGKKVKSATLFPLTPKQTKPNPNTLYYATGIAVVFAEALEFAVLGLGGLTFEGNQEEGKKLNASILFKWRLSAAASAIAFDEHRSTVVIGMKDGSLCLWNLTTRALTSVLGRHETAVSTLCFSKSSQGKTSDNQYCIISGAEDGSICLFKVLLPRVDNAVPSLFEGSEAVSNSACIATSFTSFRLDVNAGVSIVSIRAIGDYAWAAVQCSDGMCIVYDVLNGNLLGRFSLYSGMTSRQVDWQVYFFKEMLLPPVPPPIEEENVDDLGYPIGGSEKKQETNAEKKKEGVDPNDNPRLPPGKRALKYAISKEFDCSGPINLNSIATSSKLGYHCMYHRNGCPVLALFKVEDILVNFYPKVAAIVQAKTAYNVDIVDFFKKLSPSERMNPEAASLKASADYDVFGDRNGGGTAATSKRNSISRASDGSINKTLTSSTSRRRVSTSETGSASASRQAPAMTKKNLEALQSSLGVPTSIKSHPKSIRELSYERIVDPLTAASKSATNSNLDRLSRKNRVMKNISKISSSFDSF